jgi:hypothetical protein
MKSLWSLFIHCQSLPNVRQRQIVVGITVCCPKWLNIKYTQMPSPICQNMVNLIVGLPIRRHPNVFMYVSVGTLQFWLRFLDVKKFTNPTPLSLLILCKLSYPIVWLKISFLLTLALKSPNNIFIWYLGNLHYATNRKVADSIPDEVIF